MTCMRRPTASARSRHCELHEPRDTLGVSRSRGLEYRTENGCCNFSKAYCPFILWNMKSKKESAAQDPKMVVAVRLLLAALLGLYWSSSRVEGNQRELNVATCIFLLHHSNVYQKPEEWEFELC